MNDAETDGQTTKPVAWWHWHRRLYDWVIHFAGTRYGTTALFVLSFAESSFFPVPPDVLLAPLALGAPRRWFRFAAACSLASILGGVLGYLIGVFLWTAISPWAYAHLGFINLTQENFDKFQGWYDRYDFWIVFTCGFHPFALQGLYDFGRGGADQFSGIPDCLGGESVGPFLPDRWADGLEGRADPAGYRQILQLAFIGLCRLADRWFSGDQVDTLMGPAAACGRDCVLL